MELSDQARKYLEGISRDKDYTLTDRVEVEAYLKKQGIPVFPKIVEYQVLFSGLNLEISDEPGSKFSAGLFTKKDIRSNEPIDYFEVNGVSYFYCGDHETAQMWFVASELGEMCTCNNERDEIYPWHSSFLTCIESYAMENLLQLSGKFESPYYYDLIDSANFQLFVKEYRKHAQASDDYNEWYQKDDIVIAKGPWLDHLGSNIHIYGDSEQSCEQVISSLRDGLIIK